MHPTTFHTCLDYIEYKVRTLNTKVKVVRFRFTKTGQGGLLKVDEVISLVGAPLMIATTTGMPAATVLAQDKSCDIFAKQYL